MSNCHVSGSKMWGDEDSMHHRSGEKGTPCIIDVRKEVSDSIKRISLRYRGLGFSNYGASTFDFN